MAHTNGWNGQQQVDLMTLMYSHVSCRYVVLHGYNTSTKTKESMTICSAVITHFVHEISWGLMTMTVDHLLQQLYHRCISDEETTPELAACSTSGHDEWPHRSCHQLQYSRLHDLKNAGASADQPWTKNITRLLITGGRHYSDRLCSDRRYFDNSQSGRPSTALARL